MNPATYLAVISGLAVLVQAAKTILGKVWPVANSGTAGRILAAAGALLASLIAHGATFTDPGFYVDALLTFLGSAGVYHTLAPGQGSASVSLKLLALAVGLSVGLSACATIPVPVGDAPLSCEPAPVGVCQSGAGLICSGTITSAGQTRHVAITYCETPIVSASRGQGPLDPLDRVERFPVAVPQSPTRPLRVVDPVERDAHGRPRHIEYVPAIARSAVGAHGHNDLALVLRS